MQSDRFLFKSGNVSKKVCYKLYCADTFSSEVVRHSLACLTMHKWFVGPLNVNFVRKVNHPLAQILEHCFFTASMITHSINIQFSGLGFVTLGPFHCA